MAKLTQSKNLQFTSLNKITDEIIKLAQDNSLVYSAYDQGYFDGLKSALFMLGISEDEVPTMVDNRIRPGRAVNPVRYAAQDELSAAMEARLAEMQQETLNGVEPSGYSVTFNESLFTTPIAHNTEYRISTNTSSGTMVRISTPGESNE